MDAQTHSSPQGEDAGTPPRPMSPLLANANVGVAALGDTMIMAATDDVNYTPSPQTTPTDRRLKRFIE